MDSPKENTSLNINSDNVPFWTSYRFLLAILGFLGFVNIYTIRVNMSVAVVCMVNHTALLGTSANPYNTTFNDTSTELEDDICPVNTDSNSAEKSKGKADNGTFLWDKHIQGLILGSFFWGYLMTQVFGGWLSTKFGGRRVWGYNIIIASIASLITPVAANAHYILLIMLRILIGMTTGVSFPAMHTVWGNWAPPMERTKLLSFTYAGTFLGNVVTFPISALLCEYGFGDGWSSVFYIFGVVALLWALVWLFLVTDTPSQHKRISKIERDYIVTSLKSDVFDEHTKVKVPWLSMFTSMPVYAIIVSNISADWGVYTLLTGIPTYMKEVLKFDIAANGLASALPYIGLWILINVFAVLADFVRKKNYLNTTWTRRSFDATGKIIPAILLIGLGYMDCRRPYLAVGLLTLAVSLTGLQYSGFIVNHVDIAPPVAGILFGISNSLAAITGFISPLVTAAVTPNGTQEEWQVVFYISAAVYIFGAIFYFLFASGEIQPWSQKCVSSTEPKVVEVSLKPLMPDSSKV
ncbi:sialin [Octopus sinensis]|uniref:Sialin n=1 Tax=Octopus sinensis TaxID=2607531 RepID=A0A6P7TE53_9MOLL|nr:sialin [Octopus sinensis]